MGTVSFPTGGYIGTIPAGNGIIAQGGAVSLASRANPPADRESWPSG